MYFAPTILSEYDQYLHRILMQSDDWYNHCYWSGLEGCMVRLRAELALRLAMAHG